MALQAKLTGTPDAEIHAAPYVSLIAQIDGEQVKLNTNRGKREEIATQKGRVQEQRQALLMGRHSKVDLELFDATLKNYDLALKENNEEYVRLGNELRPLLLLRDSSKDCLLANRIPIPTGVRGVQPLATFSHGPKNPERFKLLKFSFKKAAAGSNPVVDFEDAKKDRAEIGREITRVESLPVDSQEIITAWDKVIEEQATRFTSPCRHMPDRTVAGFDLIQDTVAAEKDGRVGLDGLVPLICALLGDELKKHVRSVNVSKDGITTAARAEKLKELQDRKIAADYSLEIAARRIEASGARVVRPGDLDPRVFLAREL
jgi:hypothetical protein